MQLRRQEKVSTQVCDKRLPCCLLQLRDGSKHVTRIHNHRFKCVHQGCGRTFGLRTNLERHEATHTLREWDPSARIHGVVHLIISLHAKIILRGISRDAFFQNNDTWTMLWGGKRVCIAAYCLSQSQV